MQTPVETRIALIAAEDEAEVLAFERANREFFAQAVGDRGDDYFATFAIRHAALVAENEAGTAMLHVVRDGSGRLVGRVNLGKLRDGSAQLGYRIAQNACGRGHATAAVRLALEAAAHRGLTQVTAMTTVHNIASQRTLLANGFERLPSGTPAEVEVEGVMQLTSHFRRRL